MPKRGNPFQSLVRALHEQKPSGARVRESVELVDRVTGSSREVDVVVDLDLHGHSLTISVECVDRRRPAGAPWVEQMIEKHADLPTDKLILVSASGFSRGGLAKATAKGADAVSLGDVGDHPWTTVVGKLDSLLLESVKAHIGIVVFETQDQPWPGTHVPRSAELVRGDVTVSVPRFIDAVLSKRELMEVAIRVSEGAEGDGCTIGFAPSPGMKVRLRGGDIINVHDLSAVFIPQVRRDSIPLTSGVLSETPVAWGGLRDEDGRELDVSIIESETVGAEVFVTERIPGRPPRSGSLADLLIAGLDPASGEEIRALLAKADGAQPIGREGPVT
jgi:hypothetical protein